MSNTEKPAREVGCPSGFARRTVAVRTESIATLGALAFYDRRTLRETHDAAIQAYLDSRKKDIPKARRLAAQRAKESET